MSEEVQTNANMAVAIGSMPWWLVLIWGIMAVIIGFMLITTPVITTISLIMFIGAYWFVGGIFTLVSLINDRRNSGWKIFLSIISILAGAVIMLYPVYSSLLVLEMLVILIGFWGLLIGGTKLYTAIPAKDAGSGILGALSIIFGIILLVYPLAAAFSLPFVVAFFALIAGFSSIFVSFQMKKTVEKATL